MTVSQCVSRLAISPRVGNKLISPTRKHHKDFVERAEIEKERSKNKQQRKIAVEGVIKKLGERCDGLKRRGRAVASDTR